MQIRIDERIITWRGMFYDIPEEKLQEFIKDYKVDPNKAFDKYIHFYYGNEYFNESEEHYSDGQEDSFEIYNKEQNLIDSWK